MAVYEGISEHIVGSTHALQNNRQFWFKIKDISAFYVQNWEAMLTLMLEAILEMHQTMLRLVKTGVLLEEGSLHSWQSVTPPQII